jgi:hypothetical protein
MSWRLVPENFGVPLLIRTLNERFTATPPQSANATVPATAASTGTAGQVAYDASYLYVCVATNTWKRVTLSTF